jgi:arginine/ornithine N-succinyltransferase beta subunit
VKSVREAIAAKVADTTLDEGENVLLASGRHEAFRCCFGQRRLGSEGIAIDPNSAKLLALGEGGEVWSIAR